MNELFQHLETALRSVEMPSRTVAEATAAVIDKHEARGNLDDREAEVLRGILFRSLLDPFAQRDPEWTQAFRPKIAGRYADGTPVYYKDAKQ
ncbi:hypothetical protein PV394_16205 [Streptomyces sp. NE06-03E]|uniref:hypothetical protein n=1 Tax=unclassified Streptomyces TaxID=2593676 RepID=UPI000F558C49|nr:MULTISPECIES: hypothetical protein [unclassified Streptomyces]MDX3056671.1 hypothetical protein [Streptomyces sp. NE06-03E]RPK50403.1 hypothetical protein EES40_05795 [Streptomyces sp. ADI93-02]